MIRGYHARSYGPSHRVAASSSAFVEDAAARNFEQMGRVLGSVMLGVLTTSLGVW